ncbi:MAG: rhomboid family intramembrane serine protease, partial [Candidatus Aenigmarchaeota archaeon]|nr:rhomboid family intramembrane serine protease [Candidatus Aenigmarchaeota archaeon]
MVRLNITIVLAILCAVVTVFSWFLGAEQIFDVFGYSTSNLLSGNIYVLVTSVFLHSSVEHLVLNLLVMLLFGFALEEEIGSKKLLLLFFFGAFFGDLLSSLFYSATTISVGASGGIYSIIAATLLIKPIKMEVFLPIPLGIFALGYLLSSIIGLLIGYPPNVSHIAHIGGAFVGLFYGFKVKGFRKGLRILIGI